MPEKDVLSQEEIDALLDSVDDTGDDEEAQETATEASGEENNRKKAKSTGKAEADSETDINTDSAEDESSGNTDEAIKTLKFTGQERIVKGQLPVLDKIYDRAVRLFAADIYHLTANDFEIKQDPLLITKHKDFMKGLPNPSLMGIYKFKPLRGKAIILFDSTFVYDIVDYYFGGTSQFGAQKDKTDFTATELRVMDIVFKKLVADLMHAWEPIIKLDVSKFNEETNPQLVNIADPEEMVLVTRFSLNFGKDTGNFYFILPYSMLEPIKQQLELGASRPDDEIDPNWIKSLKEELMDVEVVVSSVMAESESSLGKVMEWKAGDFIPLDKKDVVTLDVEGTPAYTATMGSMNDKRALKIIKIINY